LLCFQIYNPTVELPLNVTDAPLLIVRFLILVVELHVTEPDDTVTSKQVLVLLGAPLLQVVPFHVVDVAAGGVIVNTLDVPAVQVTVGFTTYAL
jgi:hypothetical protein